MIAGSSTRGGGIWKYDSKSWSSLNANLTGGGKTAFSFAEKADGTIYAGTGEGVWEKTPSDWMDISGDMTSLSNDVRVYELLEDRNGYLVAGTASCGVWCYNGKAWEDINGELGKENYTVYTMIKTKDGAVYIGARIGLLKYDGNKVSKIPGMDMTVHALLEDNGLLYMTGYGGTATTATGKGMWTYDGAKFTGITASLSGDALDMLDIMKPKDGKIYTITKKCSLWAYDGTNWKNIKASMPDEKVSATNTVNLAEDNSGNIYLMSSSGFWKYDGNEWAKFTSGKIPENKPQVWGFLEAKSGIIYGGLNGGGILIAKPPKATPQAPQKNTAAGSSRFSDVQPGIWYYDDVEYVVAKGLFSGTAANLFSPNMTLTRGMIVTVLGRLASVDTAKYKRSSFSDVDENIYYAPYVKWAAEIGIAEGRNGKFSPEDFINRQDFTLMLNLYSEYMWYELPVINVKANFTDANKISSYARDAVYIMQQAGVISGKENNMLDPMANITRAEFSAMLHRFMGLTTDDSVPKG